MSRQRSDEAFYFEGFVNPTTTPVPDVVFDRLLARLGEAEIKALLYIIRRTFGFKKSCDSISFNQFLRGITTRDGRTLDEGCGVRDRTTLSKALKSLEGKGIVVSAKGVDERGENVTTVYSLRFQDVIVENSARGVVGNSYHPGRDRPLPVVGNSYPQQTEIQETVEQQTDQSSTEIQQDALHNESFPFYGKEKQLRSQTTVDNPAATAPADPLAGERLPRGVSRIGQLLPHLPSASTLSASGAVAPPAPAPAPPPTRATTRGRLPQAPYIAAVIADFTHELHDDDANLRANITRATRLWQTSGLSEERFVQDVLYPARSATRQQGGVKKRASAGGGLTNRMPYFFAVVQDRLGLRDGPTNPPPR